MLRRLCDALIRRTVPGGRADDIVRDLREEYDRYQRPMRGLVAASGWYVRQVMLTILAIRRPALHLLRDGSIPRTGVTADVRDAWRSLRKTPLQTCTMVASLAIGAGLMVATFAAGNALVAGEQPGIRDRRSLFFVELRGSRETDQLTIGQYINIDWNSLPSTVLSAGAEMSKRFDVVIDGVPQRVQGSLVTGGFFDTLGTVPHLGRLIARADEHPSTSDVAVVSHGFWQRVLGGRPDVIGETMHAGGRPIAIIGVAPPGFVGTRIGELGAGPDSDEDIWMVLRTPYLKDLGPGYRRSVGPYVVVRIANGVAPKVAEASLGALLPRVLEEGEQDHPTGIALLPFRYAELHEVSNGLASFFGAILLIPTLVLLIGAANVASLQAARASWRVHELSVRTSLGATRWRLARLLAIETLMLAVCSTVVAWVLSLALLKYGAGLLPFAVSLDWRVLLFSLGIPALIMLVIGIAPSWRATGVDVLAGLRLGGRWSQGHPGSFRRTVVSAQIAVSVALVLASLVLARSLVTGPMGKAQRGSDVLVAGFYQRTLPQPNTDRRASIRALMAGLSQLAPPSDLAFSTGEVRWIGSWGLGDNPDPRDASRWVAGRHATSSIFGLLGVELTEGRLYGDTERGLMVVNETFARRHSPDRPIVGSVHRVRPSGIVIMNREGKWVDATGAHTPEELRVVGVVSDGFERDSRGRVRAAVYAPLDLARTQSFAVFMRPSNMAEAQRRIRDLAMTVVPVATPDPLATISALTDEDLRGPRWASGMLGYTGLLALALASVGLFALISTIVAQRRYEYAVRVALGARRRSIIQLVVGDAARLTVIGLLLGFALAVPAWIVIRDDVAAHATMIDPWTVSSVVGVLMAVAGAAAFVPARRAAAADPLSALRG